VGLSVLSGAHLSLCRKVRAGLSERGLDDVKLILGGTIPEEDEPGLKQAGADAVFPTGSKLEAIVEYVKSVK